MPEGRVGGHRLVRKLGEGGMGVVYVARHETLGSKVAVKFLKPELSQKPDLVQRFFNEARAATLIKHPGIVRIFDFGQADDGSAYFVMEYLEGESLGERLKHRRYPPLEACALIRQAASVLAAAHASRIIHRDIKPDNLFLVPDPDLPGGERVKVLDFGIAKLSDESGVSSMTRTGSMMGTPYYMSPEQCRGAGQVDERADVYSLGCILFEMVCGRPPFLGAGLGEILGAQQFVAPPVPRALNPAVSPALNGLITRTLAKDPAARPQSMNELAQVLDEIVEQAQPAPPGPPPGALPDAVARVAAGSDPGPRLAAAAAVPTPQGSPALARHGRAWPLWLLGGALVAGGIATAAALALRGDKASTAASPEAREALARLADPEREADAVMDLERLKDPATIKPLGEAWRKTRSARHLRAVIAIAGWENDDPSRGPVRKAAYHDAVPFLVEAIEPADPTDEVQVDVGVIAAAALGDSGDPAALDALTRAATRAAGRNAIVYRVRMSAIRALGSFHDPRAVDTLFAIVEQEGTDDDMVAAASLALSENRDTRALTALAKAMLKVRIFRQVRDAVTRVGRPMIPVLMSSFQGWNEDVNAQVKKLGLDEKQPGVVQYQAARLLGDLRAREAIPMLVAGLEGPGKPLDTEYAYITHQDAILEALSRLGPDARSQRAVWALAKAGGTPTLTRVRAIDAYSFVEVDPDAGTRSALLSFVRDEKLDTSIRASAVRAYSRLARTRADARQLAALAPVIDAGDIVDKLHLAREARERANAIETVLCPAEPPGEIPTRCLAAAIEDGDLRDERSPARIAAELALLSLSRAPGDEQALDVLLRNAGSEHSVVREGVLHALPLVAGPRCDTCANRLREILETQASQGALVRLNDETRVVYHYFLQASR